MRSGIRAVAASMVALLIVSAVVMAMHYEFDVTLKQTRWPDGSLESEGPVDEKGQYHGLVMHYWPTGNPSHWINYSHGSYTARSENGEYPATAEDIESKSEFVKTH